MELAIGFDCGNFDFQMSDSSIFYIVQIRNCITVVHYTQCTLYHVFRCHNAAREVIVSESMTLTQFAERHYKDLPLQIKVLRGYCGSTSRLTSKYHMYK